MFTLREKCPNTDFFQVRIFLYSDDKSAEMELSYKDI